MQEIKSKKIIIAKKNCFPEKTYTNFLHIYIYIFKSYLFFNKYHF